MANVDLAGKVTNEDGSSSAGVVVELWEASAWETPGARTAVTTTDSNGNWSFASQDSTKTWIVVVLEKREVIQDGQSKLQVTDLDVISDVFADTISEHTSGSGVTIDGVLLKDTGIGGGASIAWDGRVLFDKGADIASGAAITPGTDGNYFHITGTTTITSIATLQAGAIVIFEFDGALTLTHNATTLILQDAANLTTAAGDVIGFVSEGSGNWRELFRRLATAVFPAHTLASHSSEAHSELSGVGSDDHHAQTHATAHASGGADAVKLDDLSAPDDNTDLNFSTSVHGLVPKGTNVGNFLKDDGTWAAGGSGAVTALNNATVNEMVTIGATTTELEAEANLLYDGNTMFMGDTANANMTVGLTINQGATTDEILAFKSSSIAHGVTDFTETDTWGYIHKADDLTGGMNIYGLSEYKSALVLYGIATTADTGRSTSGRGAIDLNASLKSGTGKGSMGTDASLVTFIDHSTTRFIFDAEGSAHADVEWTTYDDYNDIELLRGVHGALVPGFQERFGQDMLYNLQTYEDLKLVGKDSVHIENRADGRVQLRGMVNTTGMMMLHHSTIIQMHDHFSEVTQSQEQRLDTHDEEIVALREANENLSRQMVALGAAPGL